MKKKMMALLLAVVFLVAAVGAAQAAALTKQIKVTYRDIKIVTDGKTLSIGSTEEPFIFNGATYVPLRLVAEAIKSDVSWHAQTNTVDIRTKASANDSALKLQLAQKDAQISSLQKQVDDLKKQINDDKNKFDDEDLKDLEDDLIDDYDTLGDVDIEDIKLDGDKDRVDVEIEVDLRDYEDEWADLSDSQINNYAGKIVKAIQNELSRNTKVVGEIIDVDSDDILIKFSKDGDRNLKVTYRDDYYRGGSAEAAEDVIDELKGDTYTVDSKINFVLTDMWYYESQDKITVYMTAKKAAAADWYNLSSKTKKNEVTRICEDIVDEFDDEGVDLETVSIVFYDQYKSSLLANYTYDVSDEELD